MSKPTITRDEANWEIVVKAEIPADHIAEHRLHVLKDLQRTVKLDGFRPGKAPESAVIKAVGENAILRETIEHAVQHELPEILAGESVNIVASPRVSVEKAPTAFPATEPIVFTARAPLAPEVKLPDYATIAKQYRVSKQEVSVTNEEHADTMTHLKRERARITKIELGTPPHEAHEQSQKMETKDLPELDEAFVQSLGYESLEKFSENVRTNIKTEKELRETEKRRAAMLDELVEKAAVKYPALLREYELDDMEARLQQNLADMRATMDTYLAETKKTREGLREEWKVAADKRAKMRLVLSHIAIVEKIEPNEERLAKEFVSAKQHYPQADDTNLKAHISHALRNEAVISWLEEQK